MPVRDLRYAWRQLLKAPGFTLTVVSTLALGIGALTTVATWTNAILFNPWPHVYKPTELRFVSATVLGSQGYSVNYGQYTFLREQGSDFCDAAAFGLVKLSLAAEGGEARAVWADAVSSGYFRLLGLEPQLGRFFDSNASDRAFGQHDEIVLSDALWHSLFNADRSIVGRTVSVNRHLFTVIGVAPARFAGIFGGLAELAWIPLSATRSLSVDPPADPLAHRGLQVVLRERPETSDRLAATELHQLARRFAAQHAADNLNGWDLNLEDAAHFSRGFFGFIGEQLPVLYGASILLMILVAINIASLLGHRAARRRREVAIRTALGAPLRRIAAQIFVEAAMLAAAGAICGWLASIGLSRALYVLLPSFGATLAFNLQSDPLILAFVAAVAVLVTLVCGMVPVRQSLRASQKDVLSAGGAAVVGAGRKLTGHRILLGIQLAICFVVLVSSGLLTRTALNILWRPVGFDHANCLTAELTFSRAGYNKDQVSALRDALAERLRALPGVTGVTYTSHLPMGDEGSGNTQDFAVPGYTPAKGEDMEVVTDFEGPDFFRTMSIAIERGRDFLASDNEQSMPVAIVNETMARKYWPNGDAIGHSITYDKKPWQIVGVVPEFTYHSPSEIDPTPILFLPMNQAGIAGYTQFAVRTNGSLEALAPELRQAVASLNHSLPVENLRSFDEVVAQMYQMSRLPAELLVVYALASLVVAMLGLYAVTAYAVAERNREFALRMALGSTRAGIFRLVFGGNAIVALIGFVAGGLGSMGAVRLLRAMLFGVTVSDPATYAVAAIVLLATILLAGLGPARRAASIEPMQALRSE
ncbi:MAG: ADOP family duplicated permease [Terracidiphilus sp.]